MLARTPLTEIAIEQIDAMVRPLNCWQLSRAKHVRGPNRRIAMLAFSCGMSVKQFKKLPVEHQELVRRAVLMLMGTGRYGDRVKPGTQTQPGFPSS